MAKSSTERTADLTARRKLEGKAEAVARLWVPKARRQRVADAGRDAMRKEAGRPSTPSIPLDNG